MKRNGRADELAKKSPERNPRPPTAQHRFAIRWVPTSGSTARGTKPRIHRPRQGNRADVQFGTLQNVVHSAGASSVPRQVASGQTAGQQEATVSTQARCGTYRHEAKNAEPTSVNGAANPSLRRRCRRQAPCNPRCKSTNSFHVWPLDSCSSKRICAPKMSPTVSQHAIAPAMHAACTNCQQNLITELDPGTSWDYVDTFQAMSG